MSAYLLVDGQGRWSFVYTLKEDEAVRMGRRPGNQVVLPDREVSGEHARMIFQGGQWIIEDNASRNGTFVNNERIQKVSLKNGDQVRVGQIRITFNEVDQARQTFNESTFFQLQNAEESIRGFISEGAAGDDMDLPEIRLGAGAPAASRESAFDRTDSRRIQPSEQDEMRKMRERDDLFWVAQEFADLLRELRQKKPKEKGESFVIVLERLRRAIRADNGFLMIPSRSGKRWVICAWVGDSTQWTDYAQKRPVPLTVANDAFERDTLVSNSLATRADGEPEPASSESMMALNVHCYIALPIHRGEAKEGLLYFDTRSELVTWTQREVKLLEKVGNFILEIESLLQ